ncbi:MAG: DUF2148 domain-containing protein [Bacteroidales bacterium]|jgi:uncharacterized ferredoxin-like protein|nr:DUF2148 domain-containing protein [Bacteroidales bacterium]
MIQSPEGIPAAIEYIANYMMIAAQTAPKGRGMDNLLIKLVTEEEKTALIVKMKEIGEKANVAFFLRDAENLTFSQQIILIGTKTGSRGLDCGLCSYAYCKDKPQLSPCIFNTIDVGIALGSAVSSAMQFKTDNRIMYSAGKAAMELKILGENAVCIFAIPLSVSEKNIFFDRG